MKKIVRKSMLIRPSGRSTDYITPSFGFGCKFECLYCYMKRHKPTGLDIATNTNEILLAINSHVYFAADVEKPNQTHSEYITYDLSCNEDFALHAKYHNWQMIFDFFKEHPIAMGSFATKFVNNKLLEYNANSKVRIRFSLMPQVFANYLEPNTSSIMARILAIDKFIEAGYDVHINFSPVIVVKNWLNYYQELFELVNKHVKNKHIVKAEVIFLTHNRQKHLDNLNVDPKAEKLLWNPKIQETKMSQYGGENIRYNYIKKAGYIEQFKQLHNSIIPWCTIRYIF